MRTLLNRFFGERSEDALIVHRNGRDWVSSQSLCTLTGTRCGYGGHQWVWTEMNLTQEDKCKLTVRGAHRARTIWFVSETGFWKIVARSNTLWARKFRMSFLPTQFQ